VIVVDASVVLRWFVTQPGHEQAASWLERFADDPELLVAPDLLRFEVFGGLCRLQAARDTGWAWHCFSRFERLGMRMIPTSLELFERAAELSQQIRMGGYDAVYLAHAESLQTRWLTADERALRRLAGDPRVQSLL